VFLVCARELLSRARQRRQKRQTRYVARKVLAASQREVLFLKLNVILLSRNGDFVSSQFIRKAVHGGHENSFNFIGN
jgi:hypothetical protein